MKEPLDLQPIIDRVKAIPIESLEIESKKIYKKLVHDDFMESKNEAIYWEYKFIQKRIRTEIHLFKLC